MVQAGTRREAESGPVITVLIPSYNRADYLRDSIESVLAQEGVEFAVKVCDNASTDETDDVVHSIEDPRFSYVRRAENLGWLGNFNKSLEGVETDYVTLLGDDDQMLPGSLAASVGILEKNPSVGMVHGAFDVFGPDGDVWSRRVDWTKGLHDTLIETGAEFISRSMLGSNRVCSPTAVMRTAALPEVAFDPVDGAPADLTLWLRIALDWDVAFVADPLIRYRVHPDSDSAHYSAAAPDGYVQGFDIIEITRRAKLRFLERHTDRLDDPDHLRRLAIRGSRWDVIDTIRGRTEPDRRLRPALAMLREGAQYDAGILLEPYTWRMLGGSLVGERAMRWLRSFKKPRRAG